MSFESVTSRKVYATHRLSAFIVNTSLRVEMMKRRSRRKWKKKGRKRHEKIRKEKADGRRKREVRPNMAAVSSAFQSQTVRRVVERASERPGAAPKACFLNASHLPECAGVSRSLYSRIARDGRKDLQRARDPQEGPHGAHDSIRLDSARRFDSETRARDIAFCLTAGAAILGPQGAT